MLDHLFEGKPRLFACNGQFVYGSYLSCPHTPTRLPQNCGEDRTEAKADL
jgi:hypothetical protein